MNTKKKGLLFLTLVSLTFVFSQEKSKDSIAPETLDEVLIKSVRVKEDAPVTHSNVSKQELKKRNLAQDIPVLLNFLPSVVTTTDAGAGVGYTYIRVRGSDASRVNITINGIPYNDAESQGTFWVNMPDFASSVQSLQLQRGVGTSTNGSGAFGASLNILTDAVFKKPNAEINATTGSYNTQKFNAKFSTGLLNHVFELSGRLSRITSDGYIDRASSNLKSYFLQGVYKTENTQIKALAFGGKERTYQAWYGIDAETLKTNRTFNPAGIYTDDDGTIRFYENEVDNYNQDHYQLHWNQRYNNNWSSSVSLNYTYGRGYFEQYKEDADMQFHNLTPFEVNGNLQTETDLVRRRWLDNDFYVLNTNVNYRNQKIDLLGGAFYSYYDGDHFGEVIWAKYYGSSTPDQRYYEGNGKKTELTFFTKATYEVTKNISAYIDLQQRLVGYKTTGLTSDKVPLEVDEFFSFFNPKAGITLQLDKNNQVYASYGRAHREPRRSDFENGVTKPEKLDDYELGWRFNTSKIILNTNVYFMNYKDQLVLTGAIDDVGAPIRATSGKSYRLGLEVDAQVSLSKKIIWTPNITLSTNKNNDFITSRDGYLVNLGDTNISFSPSIVAGTILTFKPVNAIEFSVLSKYVGKQYMGNIDSETSVLDPYFTTDFNILYTLKKVPFAKQMVFTGLVNNIFNTAYVSNGYFYTYDDTWSVPGTTTTIEGAGYYPQARLNFLVGVNVVF